MPVVIEVDEHPDDEVGLGFAGGQLGDRVDEECLGLRPLAQSGEGHPEVRRHHGSGVLVVRVLPLDDLAEAPEQILGLLGTALFEQNRAQYVPGLDGERAVGPLGPRGGPRNSDSLLRWTPQT